MGRRSNIESSQRKDATFVANAIAVGVAQNLRWPATSDPSVNFEYSTLMVKFLTDLLASDRSSGGGLHLIFLKALDKQEGMDCLIALFARYSEEAAHLTDIPEADRDAAARLRLIHAIGGLKVFLGVFDSLTSSKALLSPGHLLLLTQDPKSASFFDPHAFLVKLRARILPAVSEMWNSDFLGTSPPIIVRAVFRIILHIIDGQGESSDEVNAPPFTSGLASRAQVQPSQDHVNMLIDMGFPRAACEQALTRRNNNVQTAADYLMSHPEVVAAARTREAAQDTASNIGREGMLSGIIASSGGVPVASAPASDVEMNEVTTGALTPLPPTMEEEIHENPLNILVKGKDSLKKYSKIDLDNLRASAKATFISRALILARDHGELVFDIRDALKTIDFKTDSGSYDTSKGLNTILEDLDDLLQTPTNTAEKERGLAVRVRLVALIFSDTAFRRSADACYERAMAPVEALVKVYFEQDFQTTNRPKWLASIMLLAELVLVRSEMPQSLSGSATDPENGETAHNEAEVQTVLRGPAFNDQRQAFFELCVDVLRKGITDRAEFQSSMRLLLLLTRRHELACKFVEQGGLPALMSAYDQGRKDADSFQQYAIMILRHTIEDKGIIQGLVQKHVDGWLSRPRRSNDTGTYTRDLNADACRDTAIFVEITTERCNLIDGPVGNVIGKRLLSTKNTGKDMVEIEASVTEHSRGGFAEDKIIQDEDASTAVSMPMTPSVEKDMVMHFLLGETSNATTAVLKSTPLQSLEKAPLASNEASIPAETEGSPPTLSGETPSVIPAAAAIESQIPQALQDYSYSTFLLTCIGELVSSYMPCKLAFLSYGRRKPDVQIGLISSATKNSKSRSQFLSYVLRDLVPTGSLLPGSTIESKKRFALSAQAISILVALCSEDTKISSEHPEEPSLDLTDVRRSVLDAIARAFRDLAMISEPMSIKYGRISSLCSVCSRLLAPPIPVGSTPLGNRAQSELSVQMAKLMLEKNFAVIFTNALAEVDLNYPSVQNLINAILSPLEHLTKLITKIGRAVEKNDAAALEPTVHNTLLEEEASSEESVHMAEELEMEADSVSMTHEDADRPDETDADVYRNSALGMFDGELEHANPDEQYISGDDHDEEMEEWDDGEDEMMDEEGVVPR